VVRRVRVTPTRQRTNLAQQQSAASFGPPHHPHPTRDFFKVRRGQMSPGFPAVLGQLAVAIVPESLLARPNQRRPRRVLGSAVARIRPRAACFLHLGFLISKLRGNIRNFDVDSLACLCAGSFLPRRGIRRSARLLKALLTSLLTPACLKAAFANGDPTCGPLCAASGVSLRMG